MQYKKKQILSFFMIVVLMLNTVINVLPISAQSSAEKVKEQILGDGITHKEINTLNYINSGLRQNINIVKANLNHPDVEVKTTKALDRVIARETLSQQAAREEKRGGHHFVAGVNADLFHMIDGSPLGVHIKNGKLLVTHASSNGGKLRPSFAIDRHKQPMIAEMYAIGQLKFGKQDITIDTLNRNDINNRTILYTSEINQQSSLEIPYDNGAYVLMTATDAFNGIIPGQTISAKMERDTYVEQSKKGTQVQLKQNQFLLAAFGDKADTLRHAMQETEDDDTSFIFNVYANGQVKNDIEEAITSQNWLVQNGHAYTSEELKNMGYGSGLTDSTNARTAIGLTANNELILYTVDKPSATYSQATGFTNETLAKAMKAEGAIVAVNLDGGGSTQMNIKPEGTNKLIVQNYPGDNEERPITNGIFINYKGKKTTTVGKTIVEPKKITMYKNASYPFNVKATDKNGHAINLKYRDVKWETSIGEIDEKGVYKAPNHATEAKVTATINKVPGNANISVVDQIDQIKVIGDTSLVLNKGDTHTFDLKAFYKKEEVYITSDVFTWELDNASIGTIKDGVLRVNKDVPSGTEGTVTVRLGDLKEEISISVGIANKMIQDMENFNLGDEPFEGSRNFVRTYHYTVSDEVVKNGQHSLKLDYHYGGWVTGNGAMYANMYPYGQPAPDHVIADVLPKKLGMWVYSDGSPVPWVRAVVKDGNGQNKTLNLTSGKQAWNGWRFLEVDIPEDYVTPIHLYQVYLVELDKSLQGNPNAKGTVYIDDIQWIYNNDLDVKGPEVSLIHPKSSLVLSDQFTFEALIHDDKSGVDIETIKLTLNGKEVKPKISEQADDSVEVTTEFTHLSEGDYHVILTAKDKQGNEAVPYLDQTFTVDLSPDEKAPEISYVTPTATAVEKTSTPRITFKLSDDKTGVNSESVQVFVNGEKVETYYDDKTGWGYAISHELKDGKHVAVIQAQDNAGNSMEPYEVTFEVKAVKQPKDPDNFNISFITDTHLSGFGKYFMNRINQDDSELVIHLGDMVDQGKAEEFEKTLAEEFSKITRKDYLTVAGNHEAFQGDLSPYYDYFGSATYHLEYGNSLVVVLNSSLGQSISHSDSTQFDYLQKVLNNNSKQNVIVATHVTPRDIWGTGHEMEQADVEMLEGILGDYKKNNPEKNIHVMTGHLHVAEKWEKDGVLYTINGEGALKKYVPNENGNLLGTSVLQIRDQETNWKFVPYLTDMYIHDDTFQVNEKTLDIAKGASRQLDVYGDFRELKANYFVSLMQLNKDGLLDLRFISSNPDVIEIGEHNEIIAKQIGEAEVYAVIGESLYLDDETYDKRSEPIAVRVVDPESVDIYKLDVSPLQDTVNVGDEIIINATATDYYGNKFAIDARSLYYKPNPFVTIKDGKLIANKEGEATVEFSYQDIEDSFKVTVLKEEEAPPVNPGEEPGDDDKEQPEKPENEEPGDDKEQLGDSNEEKPGKERPTHPNDGGNKDEQDGNNKPGISISDKQDNNGQSEKRQGKDKSSHHKAGSKNKEMNEDNQQGHKKLPNTATSIYHWIFVGVIMTILGLALLIYRKRKYN